jgi:hypothetical protein
MLTVIMACMRKLIRLAASTVPPAVLTPVAMVRQLRTVAGPRARLSTQYRYNQLLPPFAVDALLAASLLAAARRAPDGAQGVLLAALLGASAACSNLDAQLHMRCWATFCLLRGQGMSPYSVKSIVASTTAFASCKLHVHTSCMSAHMSLCTFSGSHVHFICNDNDRAAPAGVSEAAVAEDATWLRALLAAELDTALGPEGLRTPGAIAGALGQLVADGTLVRAPGGPDSPLLRLAQRSDGARCEAAPFEGMAGGVRRSMGMLIDLACLLSSCKEQAAWHA